MGGDCVDVSVWLGWGRSEGVVVTQPKIAVSYVCYVELAGRASLPPSLPPSVCLANIRFAFNPHFSNLNGCLPSAAAVFLSGRPPHHHCLRSATLTCLMTTPDLRRPGMKSSSATLALFTHLCTSFFFFFLLFPGVWLVGCEEG